MTPFYNETLAKSNMENFYLCKPDSEEVILSGDMYSLLENAEVLKLSGEVCAELTDKRGNKFPGGMIGIMDNGKPYWFPLNGNIIPQA
jgi:hypothetical protein